jgi:hypothetical protein
MKNSNHSHTNSFAAAFVSASTALLIACVGYMALEPTTLFGQTDSDDFTITQEIGAELSFLAQPQNVTMDNTIGAVSGGTAYGSTSVRVYTNNTTGYLMSIKFSSTTAMVHSNGTSRIDNHPSSTPSYHIPSVGTDDAYFAFTASSSDLVAAFNFSGTTCNSGSSYSTSTCWRMLADATQDLQFLDDADETPAGGALTDLSFVVNVGPNNTDLPNGTYTATATLTAQLD